MKRNIGDTDFSRFAVEGDSVADDPAEPAISLKDLSLDVTRVAGYVDNYFAAVSFRCAERALPLY